LNGISVELRKGEGALSGWTATSSVVDQDCRLRRPQGPSGASQGPGTLKGDP
jgi:hypothetical protein